MTGTAEPEPAAPVTATETVKVTKTVTAPAPIHRGEPGYASHLDRDNVGVACDS